MKNVGIYVHIPFCKQKCKYCDFVSFSCFEEKMESYFECVLLEIEEKADELENRTCVNSSKTVDKEVHSEVQQVEDDAQIGINEQVEIDTIYIGGGTPSIVPAEYIEKIIIQIFKKFNVSESAEITIEVNPGTVNNEKLKKYFSIGINRLSIGLQSTNDNLLGMLGRIHTYSEFEEVYQMARSIGFRNINIDLMIGLPNQTILDVEDSLKKIIEKSPEHISVYSLIVEENTKLFDLIEQGELELPSEDLEREMYWKVKSVLEEHGYKHYEISNFAKPYYESKHNLNCWNQHYYLGFGVAAHSYFDGIRYSNIDNLKQYIENYKNGSSIYNVVFHENQEKEEMMREYMLLGLRKIGGVKISEFKNKFIDNPLYVYRKELNELVSNGLVEICEDSIRLTDKGLDLANVVWEQFV